jgi:hypothetical protein
MSNPYQESDAMTKTRKAIAKLNLNPLFCVVTLKQEENEVLIDIDIPSVPHTIYTKWYVKNDMSGGYKPEPIWSAEEIVVFDSFMDVIDSIRRAVNSEWYYMCQSWDGN